MALTEKEEKLLRHIISESTFNCDRLDLDKSWSEQSLEDPDVFISFVEIKEYNELLETNNQGSRGLLGSLVKKNLVDTQKDDVSDTATWLYIDEDNFSNIKKELA